LASVFDAITATKEDDHHGVDNDKGSPAGMMRATTTITTISNAAMTIQWATTTIAVAAGMMMVTEIGAERGNGNPDDDDAINNTRGKGHPRPTKSGRSSVMARSRPNNGTIYGDGSSRERILSECKKDRSLCVNNSLLNDNNAIVIGTFFVVRSSIPHIFDWTLLGQA
jgi:hypothetical protein